MSWENASNFQGDIAFVFLEVFLATLVVHGLLNFREKKTLQKKLNMVMGTFFSEAGTELIRLFCAFDPEFFKIGKQLIVDNGWFDREFIMVPFV